MKLRVIGYGLSFLLIFCIAGTTERAPGDEWVRKSQQEGLSELQRSVYKELAKLRGCEFPQTTHWDTIDVFATGTANPMTVLRDMGLDALPILVEALDDSTPSKTTTRCRDRIHVWKVNELAALLITQIADRQFVLGDWGTGVRLSEIEAHKGCTPDFQKLIAEWYGQNKKRTAEEQKMADLQGNLRNRLDAAGWLGENKSLKAVAPLVQRIEAVLGGTEVTSSTQEELAVICLALGSIRDDKGFPAVKKACDHLSYWIYMSYRPIKEGRSGTGSSQRSNLFMAYHGMALLGHKQEALTELNRLYKKYGSEMESPTEEEYRRRLNEAVTW